VYNIKGQVVTELPETFLQAGENELVWDGKDQKGVSVPSGLYIARLGFGNNSYTRKLTKM
jgi:flagellar hook assembly protein FlgD